MDLKLDISLVEAYKSASQRAKVLTQTWGEKNLYCPACPSDELVPTPEGTPVVDFSCPECGEEFQLKSKSNLFGKKVANSAYEPKIRAIRTGKIPNFLFLTYNLERAMVRELFVVPKHFITQSIIEQRKPLCPSARRAGWIGSNILLGQLPPDARIQIISNYDIVSPEVVRETWQRFSFLRQMSVHSRGWLSDVLACVRELGKETFTLGEVYTFEERLRTLHPRNKNIKPKIRQQLQVLRDRGVVEFLGKGVYRVRK